MTQIAALSVEEATARDIPVNFAVLLPAHLWDETERLLTRLRDAAVDRPSQGDYYDALHDFHACAVQGGPAILEALRLWRQARPLSHFPAILEVAYWSAWFGEYRGTDMADEVTPAMWTCAHRAQDTMFRALVRLLARDQRAWLVIPGILHSVAAVGEPDWWAKWLLGGERPSRMPNHGTSDEIEQMFAHSGGELIAEISVTELPEHLPAILTGEALSWRRDQRRDPVAPLQYWLRVAFAMDPFALEVACSYVSLRMPRWGGSIEEMLAFADSPLCERFSEIDRNVLRYFAWFDELELDGYMFEDPRVVQNQLRIGERLLKRPLPENLRGRVHKYVAYLFAKLDRVEEACKHYAQSAPHNFFEDWQITRAVEVWMASKDKGPWLGQVADRNCLASARGASLYGFLCSQGWAGVEKRPEVADDWYKRAAEMTPDLTDVTASPFNSLSKFAEFEGDEVLVPMWAKAAEYGDASSQFLGGFHFHGKDRQRSLGLYRQAAASNHPTAIYNLAYTQLLAICDEEITGSEADEAVRDALLHLDKARDFFPILLRADPDSINLDIWRRIKGAHAWLLRSEAFPLFAREHVLQPVLEFAGSGDAGCMVALGWWYADKEQKSYNHQEAVRWIEAARLANPDQEFLEGLLDKVEGSSFWSIFRYSWVQRRVKREGLPGQVD